MYVIYKYVLRSSLYPFDWHQHRSSGSYINNEDDIAI